MRRLAAFCALALAGCATDYVPNSGWNDDWSADFKERWYGNQLRAMHEPSFEPESSLGEFRSRFRLLVLPTFTAGFAARIDEDRSGRAILHWVILDGAGGYGPGRVASRGERVLDQTETASLAMAIDAAKLNRISLEDGRYGPPTQDERGNTTIRMCVDGTAFVFERRKADGRSFTDRQCQPDEEALLQLILETYDLLPAEIVDDDPASLPAS